MNYGLRLTRINGSTVEFWYGGHRIRRDNWLKTLPIFSGTKKVKAIQKDE